MTNELMRDFNVGGAALGSLSAFYFYAYASIQLPVGILTDRFGPRKLMSFAAVLCSVASVIFALSDSLLLASISRALIGATVAFGFVGTLAIAGYWFKPSQFATLAGLVQTIGMCGAIFGQAPLRLVVEQTGWRGMMGALAGLALILAILLWLLVPKRTRDQRIVKSGLGIFEGLSIVATNPQNWICSIIGFGLAAIMLGFGGLWGVPWLNTVHGYSIREAAGIVSTLFFAWALFSPGMGWLSDKIGRRKPVLIAGATLCLAAFSTTVFFTPQNTFLLITLLFLTGIGGCTMTIAFTAAREHNHIEISSTAAGLINMFVVGSGAVMQPLIGWLLDINWSGALENGARVYSSTAYTISFSSLLVVTAAALIASLVLRETWCNNTAPGQE